MRRVYHRPRKNGCACRSGPRSSVERSARIDASPDAILPLITDFHRWLAWSPYEKIDPAMRRTYGGPESGPGAVYAWEGNDEIGAGRMEIVEVDPASKVSIRLDFFRPMKASNVAELTLVPAGDGTRITWAMTGSYGFVAKLFGVFVDLDRLAGKDFEAGLENLKTIVER